MPPFFKPVILFLVLLFQLNSVLAQEQSKTLSIQGDIHKPVQWTIEQLKEQFADQIQDIDLRGKTTTGIPLLSVLKGIEPKVVMETKWTLKDEMHRNMVFLAILEAKDSYKVFFTLTELMPEFGDVPAWLIWDVDGKPLTGDMAPLYLLLSADKWPDRGIHGIVKITLVDLNKLADQFPHKGEPHE